MQRIHTSKKERVIVLKVVENVRFLKTVQWTYECENEHLSWYKQFWSLERSQITLRSVRRGEEMEIIEHLFVKLGEDIEKKNEHQSDNLLGLEYIYLPVNVLTKRAKIKTKFHWRVTLGGYELWSERLFFLHKLFCVVGFYFFVHFSSLEAYHPASKWILGELFSFMNS